MDSADQRLKPNIGRFHVITDYHFQQRYTHAELARYAMDGGADTIQFRQKRGTIRHRLVAARETASVCISSHVPLIIDDDIALLLATDAAGVHLGLTDLPLSVARAVLGTQYVIGGTATTVEQALKAESDGADYIGFGPVYRTRSKPNPASVKGIAGLKAVCKVVSIPVIAIAGITADRIEEVLASGAHGVAVMAAVTAAYNPQAAAAELREMIELYAV
ncbi:MAG: thiamine phosphate synthase [Rhodothermia bacterium]|nr:MAG: thiamine phosphate synthase [Rhodothermia bacterium]